GSSGNPASLTYRGPAAFSAPETQALRDFVASRVIDGVQRIKTHVTLHTNGKLVLWPYAYTYTDVPVDMTSLDHAALAAMGKGMAALNGYKAEQSSSLYISDGDEIDWLYGTQHIFSYTWELYPPETPTVWGDHYPPDETIASATANNRSALLYFLSVAWCPYSVIGKTQEDCGPFYDDFEINKHWTINPDGTDTAPAGGRFARGNPDGTTYNGHTMQNGSTVSGRFAFTTGPLAGSGANANDLDGISTIESVPIALPAVPGPLSFRYYFAHGPSSAADSLRVYVEDAAHHRTLVWQRLGTANAVYGAWTRTTASLTAFAGTSVRLVFQATDGGPNSLVEVGIDDVRVERPAA
ncbi:MAG TPA: M14 family zinc carboxypeptidase, partial [Candidatus Limnocylindrales bacterium]|nr:M14 family zinc carboxypeptidase [Candidatus Limnocylindrales bacterium]